jgi:hypothetical protein
MRRPTRSPAVEPTLPRFTRWLRPAVNAVARTRLSVHNKLMLGFLAGTLLLVGMAALSLLVIDRMNERMVAFDVEAEKVDLAQQMLYDVTAQSHYRAMALLTRQQNPERARDWNEKVAARKSAFLEKLGRLQELDPDNGPFYTELSDANERYTAASLKVEQAYEDQDFRRAQWRHVHLEHEASHDVEDMLQTCNAPGADECGSLGMPFIEHAQEGMDDAADAFHSDHRLLQKIVLAFSVVSIATALLLGFLVLRAAGEEGPGRAGGAGGGPIRRPRPGAQPGRVRHVVAGPEPGQRTAGCVLRSAAQPGAQPPGVE